MALKLNLILCLYNMLLFSLGDNFYNLIRLLEPVCLPEEEKAGWEAIDHRAYRGSDLIEGVERQWLVLSLPQPNGVPLRACTNVCINMGSVCSSLRMGDIHIYTDGGYTLPCPNTGEEEASSWASAACNFEPDSGDSFLVGSIGSSISFFPQSVVF